MKRVGDGDTLDVRSGRRVLLVQIDAPELGESECFARESKRELERDRTLDDVDRYGRLLRYVVREPRNVNVELVRRGAATPYFFGGDRGRHAGELLAALDEARHAHRGMWGACRVTWTPTRAVATRPR